MSRRNKRNKGKSSIMLLISFCDFISSAILDFFYFFYFCGTLKSFRAFCDFCVTLIFHFSLFTFHLRSISLLTF